MCLLGLSEERKVCIAVLFLMMSTVAKADEENLSLLPAGMESRLMEGSETRASWHVKNEAYHAMTTGGILLASYALHKVVDSVAPQVPVGALLTGAGIALDYSLSPTWKDFGFKQAVRTPYSVYRLYSGKDLYSWLSTLMMESPTLLTGAWESWQQTRHTLPYGQRKIHTGDQPSAYELHYHNTDTPFFSMHIINTDAGACADTTLESHSLPGKLNHVACAASQHGVKALTLTPYSTSVGKALRLCQRSDEEAICHTVRSIKAEDTKSAPWLTERLSTPAEKGSVTSALSPLSGCVLDAATRLMERSLSDTDDIQCGDMHLPVINGTHMQLSALGNTGYLLVDHTDTQHLALPEMWLVDSPLIAEETAINELAAIEGQRIPGPEYGIWRILSAARSALYHTALNKAFERWKTPLHTEDPAQRGYSTRGGQYDGEITPFMVTDCRVEELSERDIARDVQEIADLQQPVIVITGITGKSSLLNYLARKTVIPEATSYSGSQVALEAQYHNGAYFVEMQPPEHVRSNSRSGMEALRKLQHAWLQKAKYVLVSQNIERFTEERQNVYEWLKSSLGNSVGKLTAVLNAHESGKKESSLLASEEDLRSHLEEWVHLKDPKTAIASKGLTPQWLIDLGQ